jgi:myo-inositol-1(or 4)-monophosphatase
MKSEQMNLERLIYSTIKKAGEHLRVNAFSNFEKKWKKHNDPVTELDKSTEKMIRENIEKVIPVNFIGEEYGSKHSGEKYTIIMDPIDGTKAFLRKDFVSSVSIAVQQEDKLIGGFVYDYMRDIIYCAFNGRTYITFQDKEVQPPEHGQFSKYRFNLDTSTTKTVLELQNKKTPYFDQIKIVKPGGSIALNMAQTAFGIYDAMIGSPGNKGNIWDVAAGYALLEQRGIFVCDWNEDPYLIDNRKTGLFAMRTELADKFKAPIIMRKTNSN